MEQLIKRALLGDHEAAKRLTDAGVLVPCPWCGPKAKRKPLVAGCGATRWVHCPECGASSRPTDSMKEARLSWNTRAPILSESEMEMMEGIE